MPSLFSINKKTRKQSLNQGFGLVELMVSISIMVLVTSIILVKHDSFNGATLLRGQAYELALQAREVQLLAVSSASVGSGFRGVYGLYFNTVNLSGKYVIFRDEDDDHFYDESASEEFGLQGVLDPRFEVRAIRLMNGASTVVVPKISIIFERPNFDARLFEDDSNEVDPSISGVEIDIAVRGAGTTCPGAVRTVEITKTGQISVKNC